MRPVAVREANAETEAEYEIGGAKVVFTHQPPEPSSAPAAASPQRRRSIARLTAGAVFVSLVLMALVIAAADQIAARMRLTIAERVARGTSELAAQGFKAVRLQQSRQGGLEAAGLVANLAEKQRLRNWLSGSGYQDVRFKVQTADALIQQVRDTLSDSSLRIRFDGNRLRIEGTTSNLAVRQRIRSIADDLQGIVTIDDRVAYVETAEAPGSLPVRIRDVRSGDARYFSTDTGDRYFEGALLPDGAEVLAIEASQIRFRRNGRVLVYNLD
jgi:hypothetical protein